MTSPDPAAAPTLDAAQLALLGQFGTRRQVAAGETLFAEGDAAYRCFHVVLSGRVDVTGTYDGTERLLAQHGPGRFLGELNMLTGQRIYVTARMAEAGEVLEIGLPEFRRLIATVPPISDLVLAAFAARRTMLMTAAAAAVRVIGSRFAPSSLAMREFLARNRLPHEWLDAESDADVDRLAQEFGICGRDLPVVIVGPDVLRQATPGQVAAHLGLTIESIPERCFDLVVVGAGPAGLAASVYGVSEGLSTLLVEAELPGGQAGTSSRIENYLGFPKGVSGQELTDRAMTQALKFGARVTTPCEVVALSECGGHLVLALSDGTRLAGRAVVAATGAHYRRLDVPRLAEFEGTCVYYAATATEARLVEGRPIVVVGGGNSAGQAAMFLAERNCRVSLLVRGPDLDRSMSRYLAARIEVHPSIQVLTGTQVVDLHGDGGLDGVTTADADGRRTIEAAAVFSFIGAAPASGWLSGCAALDPAGFVRTDRALPPEDLGPAWAALGRSPLPFETSKPGLFAVGDLRSGSVKRVASAVGEGSAAVHSVHQHLSFAG